MMFADFMVFWFPFWYDRATRLRVKAKRLDRKIEALEREAYALRARQIGMNAEYEALTVDRDDGALRQAPSAA